MSYEYQTLCSGIRIVPSGIIASGEPLSMPLFAVVNYNQELVQDTLLSRSLCTDIFAPDPTTGDDYYVDCLPSGQMVFPPTPRYECYPGYWVEGEIWCRGEDQGVPKIHVFSTPTLPDPQNVLSDMVTQWSGTEHYDTFTVTNSGIVTSGNQYYSINLKPSDLGKYHYLSIWGECINSYETAKLVVGSLSLRETPLVFSGVV